MKGAPEPAPGVQHSISIQVALEMPASEFGFRNVGLSLRIAAQRKTVHVGNAPKALAGGQECRRAQRATPQTA